MNPLRTVCGRKVRHVLMAVTVATLLGGASGVEAQGVGAIQRNPAMIGGEAGLPQQGAGGGNALDAARQPAARGEPASPFATRQTLTTQPRATIGLNEEQRLIARRFCEDRLKPEERDAILAVPNFSALERDYCRRAGELLTAYGYETFDGVRAPDVLVNGAIPEAYRLGIGDEIVVTMRGQVSTTTRVVVDREGRVILENLAPISAAGRTFGEFRRELQARVQAAFIGTDVFVSLGAVRLIAVSVVGEVVTPGVHQLTGLSTVLDAIAVAGGVRKTGSLRRIMVERRDGTFWLDVYDLLTGVGLSRDLSLYEGDRIIVPPLGATVALSGKVRRAAVYELPEGASALSIQAALDLAGGMLRPQGNRLVVRSFDAAGREIVRQSSDRNALIGDGDLLVVEYAEDIQVGSVRIEGAVRMPGSRVRAASPTVRALVGNLDSFAPGAYLPFAVLETVEPATQSRRYFAINLQRVMAGEEDFALRDRDRLIVLNIDDVRFLSSARVQSVIRPTQLERGLAPLPEPPQRSRTTTTPPTTPPAAQQQPAAQAGLGRFGLFGNLPNANAPADQGQQAPVVGAQVPGAAPPAQLQPDVQVIAERCRGIDVLKAVVERTRSARFATAIQTIDLNLGVMPEVGTKGATCPDIFDENPDLLTFVLEHVVAVNGEVRIPGAYPIVAGTAVGVLVAVAGGVTLDADLNRVEFTRVETSQAAGAAVTNRVLADLSGQQGAGVTLNPGDIVRFSPIYTDLDKGPVLLAGEFVRPGYYDIRRGERLSQIIARAGGTTAQAYPFGAVFTRERVKRAEQEGFARTARDLNSAMVYAASRGEVAREALVALQDISAQLANAQPLGRVVIEADPTVLQVRPELDVVLEPGDTIFMPKRPNSVLVTGDVLNPGALQFIAGTTATQYIRQAGGFQRSADQDRVFIVFPNGVAQPISISVWSYSMAQIPPGSAIVAPKNPAPLGSLVFARDITQLVSQIAITAASLAVLTR